MQKVFQVSGHHEQGVTLGSPPNERAIIVTQIEFMAEDGTLLELTFRGEPEERAKARERYPMHARFAVSFAEGIS